MRWLFENINLPIVFHFYCSLVVSLSVRTSRPASSLQKRQGDIADLNNIRPTTNHLALSLCTEDVEAGFQESKTANFLLIFVPKNDVITWIVGFLQSIWPFWLSSTLLGSLRYLQSDTRSEYLLGGLERKKKKGRRSKLSQIHNASDLKCSTTN